MGSLQCDDGNLDDGDGCNSLCQVEEGWICSGGNSATKDVCEYRLTEIEKAWIVEKSDMNLVIEFTRDVQITKSKINFVVIIFRFVKLTMDRSFSI